MVVLYLNDAKVARVPCNFLQHLMLNDVLTYFGHLNIETLKFYTDLSVEMNGVTIFKKPLTQLIG
jgi:hypothetical protein